jgi:hypothetical protein
MAVVNVKSEIAGVSGISSSPRQVEFEARS